MKLYFELHPSYHRSVCKRGMHFDHLDKKVYIGRKIQSQFLDMGGKYFVGNMIEIDNCFIITKIEHQKPKIVTSEVSLRDMVLEGERTRFDEGKESTYMYPYDYKLEKADKVYLCADENGKNVEVVDKFAVEYRLLSVDETIEEGIHECASIVGITAQDLVQNTPQFFNGGETFDHYCLSNSGVSECAIREYEIGAIRRQEFTTGLRLEFTEVKHSRDTKAYHDALRASFNKTPERFRWMMPDEIKRFLGDEYLDKNVYLIHDPSSGEYSKHQGKPVVFALYQWDAPHRYDKNGEWHPCTQRRIKEYIDLTEHIDEIPSIYPNAEEYNKVLQERGTEDFKLHFEYHSAGSADGWSYLRRRR